MQNDRKKKEITDINFRITKKKKKNHCDALKITEKKKIPKVTRDHQKITKSNSKLLKIAENI